MKQIIMAALVLASYNAFAASQQEINAGSNEFNRACSQPGAQAGGSKASRECDAAYNTVMQHRDQVARDVSNSIYQRDHERQRIQQEEVWREQVRRGYR